MLVQTIWARRVRAVALRSGTRPASREGPTLTLDQHSAKWAANGSCMPGRVRHWGRATASNPGSWRLAMRANSEDRRCARCQSLSASATATVAVAASPSPRPGQGSSALGLVLDTQASDPPAPPLQSPGSQRSQPPPLSACHARCVVSPERLSAPNLVLSIILCGAACLGSLHSFMAL